MEKPTIPGGGGRRRGESSCGVGGVASSNTESDVEDLDELWPLRPSSAAADLLAKVWVDNLTTSERFTNGFGGLDLDNEVWEVRINLDGVDNLERTIGRDDITYQQIVAMIEVRGYSILDNIYCRQLDGQEVLVENSAIIYQLLDMFQSSRVLSLTVKRRVVLGYQFPYMCTQESRNVEKGKAVQNDAEDDANIFFDMGEADFAAMEELRREEEVEIAEKIEEIRRIREDPFLHCEEKQKTVKRGPGPTTRCHSSVQIDDILDYMPSSDEDEFPGFLKDEDDDYFQPITMVAPKGRKSRRKKIPPRKWYDEKRLLSASEIKGEKTFVLHKMKIHHTCPTTTESTRVSARWLAHKYESLFRSDTNTGIQTLIDSARQHYGVEVSKMTAYRAKWLDVDAVLGDHREQYVRLRDFAQTIVNTNPGSRVIVTTVSPAPSLQSPHPGPTFHGLFFCINGAREGFLKGCRPFIGLDGCFIKLCTGAQILAATGRDGNNNMYPIAFVVVPKEDTANWCWFLTQLKYALGGESGDFGYYTIMSDKRFGLLKAVSQVFPNCPQRYCLRHIYANFQTAGFRGEDLKKCMDATAYAYHKDHFDVAMENLKAESEEAWTWLSKIPVHTWARHAFDTNCKTDLVVNNLSDVFNRYILDVRKKPIRTMIEGIKNKQMTRHHDKRVGVRTARWEITPHFTEMVKEVL
ncbi:uncharacterized protein LOC124664589 [Lolium rigidum]|uniref:uncharacterized protein LOC124664589 n=1 Tax=Lolium rigidum TaxID=89674 RepID=UPI001F5DC182|nr:uncharacterized protein LOC124664589 [Lolium rigidum]